VNTHTHTEKTHGLGKPFIVAPWEQLGVKCLPQGPIDNQTRDLLVTSPTL